MKDNKSFDSRVAKLHEFFFFREFTFANCTFDTPSGEQEFSDILVYLGELCICVENKERASDASQTAGGLQSWLEGRVKKALGQLKRTRAHINSGAEFRLRNAIGDEIGVQIPKSATIHYIILLEGLHDWNRVVSPIRIRASRSVDIVAHCILSLEYLAIVRTLITPAEIGEYLGFRARTLSKHSIESTFLPEECLLGQYISGKWTWYPEKGFELHFQSLKQNLEAWELGNFINSLRDTLIGGKNDNYYKIARELALLKRTDLQEFALRLRRSIEASKSRKLFGPFRFVATNGTGFIFMAVPPDLAVHSETISSNNASVHKYDQRLDKCVALVVGPEGDGWHRLVWSYVEGPWKQSAMGEEMLLKYADLLTEVRSENRIPYTFQ